MYSFESRVVTNDVIKILNIGLILHLILGEVTKFLVERFSTSEVMSQKPHRGGGGGGAEHPSAFGVNKAALW